MHILWLVKTTFGATLKAKTTNELQRWSLNKSFLSDPAGARTQDPYIKSVMLYQLSYGIGIFNNEGAKVLLSVLINKRFLRFY
jgi:hypothetical protein